MSTLRDMIAHADDQRRPAWFDAARLATDRLGTVLAGHIHWSDQADANQWIRGTLAGDDRALALRYEPPWEPGTGALYMQVPCPEDQRCIGPAWDSLTCREDLLAGLEDPRTGGYTYDDPWCERHHGDR